MGNYYSTPSTQTIRRPNVQPVAPPAVLQPTMVSQDQNGVRYSDGRYIPWMRELPCVNSYKQKAIDFNGTTIYSTKIPKVSTFEARFRMFGARPDISGKRANVFTNNCG